MSKREWAVYLAERTFCIALVVLALAFFLLEP